MVAGDEVVDASAMTKPVMSGPPIHVDEWRMGKTELEDFRAASKLPWLFVQKRPRSR